MKSSINSVAQVLDPKYITITDFSVYNTEIPVTNALYRITISNFNAYVDIPYIPGTVMNINSNLLNLTAEQIGGLCALPSGLYIINQSICPNDKLYFEYNLFNITPDLEELAQAVCCYQDDPDKLDVLWDIKQSLELSKYLAEKCNDTKKACSLYNITAKALRSIGCSC